MIFKGLVFVAAAWMAGAQEGLLDAVTRAQDFEARRESSSNPDLTKNGDARGMAPGEELVLADVEGPGVITQMWTTLNAKDPFYGRSVVLRVYYDGSDKPSVQAPLGDFFGIGHGAHADYSSAVTVLTSRGRSRVCYWRMPFRERIRITALNESPVHRVDSMYWHINWQKHDTLPEDTMYFHAKYRQEFPAQPGNYRILETAGRGHYVGTVYSAQQVEVGWFGEGDDFFYIDGAAEPQLRGTGTEEYFLDAWGFRPFASLYGGAPLYEGVFPGDRVSVYRWHLPDPVPFTKSLKVEIEHKGSIFNPSGTLTNFELGSFEERPDWLSSVAFWYQYPPVLIEETLPPVEQRVAPYRVLEPAKLTYRANPAFVVMPSGTGVAYVPNSPDAMIEFDFEIAEDGAYQLSGIFGHAVMGGIYQAFLNGEMFGQPIDFVIPNADPAWVQLDTHKLKAGKHTLRFQGVLAVSPNSRVPAPKFHAFALEKLVLLRLEDMAGYHEVSDRLLKKK